MDGRIWVEAWGPEYGASFEMEGDLAPSEEEVEHDVETADWGPVRPADCLLPPAAFLDGVSRVDARAFLAAGTVTIPGLCGSVGIGAVLVRQRAAFGPASVHRTAVFGSRATGSIPPAGGGLEYGSRSVAGSAPEELRRGLESLRAEREAEMARRLAREGWVVVADGPLGVLEPLDVIGFIKSHRRAYLPTDLEPVVRGLGPGERTPVFAFGRIRPRYSWYLRLAPAPGQHPWAAVARCEVNAALPVARAVALADMTACHLPRFASKLFWDARAPQNLVPIATLERRLWHLLGDRELVLRRLRSALVRSTERRDG